MRLQLNQTRNGKIPVYGTRSLLDQ